MSTHRCRNLVPRLCSMGDGKDGLVQIVCSGMKFRFSCTPSVQSCHYTFHRHPFLRNCGCQQNSLTFNNHPHSLGLGLHSRILEWKHDSAERAPAIHHGKDIRFVKYAQVDMSVARCIGWIWLGDRYLVSMQAICLCRDYTGNSLSLLT